MKTLIRNEDNISIYLFEDSMFVELKETEIIVGNPVDLLITDRNLSNTTLIENVSPPSDWYGWKYKYIDGQWIEV